MNGDMAVFLSSGMLQPKKGDHELARRHLYLNYGLLGLATTVAQRGHKARVYHGGFADPDDIVQRLCTDRVVPTARPFFVSIPSYYAVEWASLFCAALRRLQPDVQIVVGGRWVVDLDGSWIKCRIPDANLVVYGTAEGRIESLLSPTWWDRIPYTDRTGAFEPEPPLRSLPDLDYRLLDGYRDYQPSIEISRGCGRGCNFCAEGRSRISALRPVQRVLRAIRHCSDVYGENTFHPYFEASFFFPTRAWAHELRSLFRREGITTRWRCETRADALHPDTIAILADAGLKVIDLGLESASSSQLLAMGKTTNPAAYLKRASALLDACRSLGVWVKANILLFPGETEESISETVAWLGERKECLKGVSVGPLVVFGHTEETRRYLDSLRPLGALPVDEDALERVGYSELHLSRSLDGSGARATALILSRQFMTDRDYYDLKSFTYFPRSFSFDDFTSIVSATDPATLPFRVAGQPPARTGASSSRTVGAKRKPV
ncbi:MAG TPA: radical SAM protein [Anaerolineae bacterium]|nr:radical SAM protein [Anaerolineae bacterium]